MFRENLTTGEEQKIIPAPQPKENIDDYLTKVTRDMKRAMDEHTVLLKELVAVMVSIRNSQQRSSK